MGDYLGWNVVLRVLILIHGRTGVWVKGLGRLQHGRLFRMECGLESLNSYTWEDGGLGERSWETTAWEII